jgi:peptidylprolyl isomerase
MAQAKAGDIVSVHYTGKLTNGTVFDSSAGREPLEFPLGAGMVIKGFDDGILGMEVGEKKTLHIPAHEAYGEADPDYKLTVNRSEMPDDMELEIGGSLNMHQEGGQIVQVTVTDLTETTVTLDGNHPLAGQDLIFDLEMITIKDGSADSAEGLENLLNLKL